IGSEGEKECSVNVFTESEIEFLDTYQRLLKWNKFSESSLKDSFSIFFKGDENIVNKVIKILGAFKINKRVISFDTSKELQEYIPYVKHMLHLFPDINSDKNLNPSNILYHSESSL